MQQLDDTLPGRGGDENGVEGRETDLSDEKGVVENSVAVESPDELRVPTIRTAVDGLSWLLTCTLHECSVDGILPRAVQR